MRLIHRIIVYWLLVIVKFWGLFFSEYGPLSPEDVRNKHSLPLRYTNICFCPLLVSPVLMLVQLGQPPVRWKSIPSGYEDTFYVKTLIPLWCSGLTLSATSIFIYLRARPVYLDCVDHNSCIFRLWTTSLRLSVL